jgi:hypothetical protein
MAESKNNLRKDSPTLDDWFFRKSGTPVNCCNQNLDVVTYMSCWHNGSYTAVRHPPVIWRREVLRKVEPKLDTTIRPRCQTAQPRTFEAYFGTASDNVLRLHHWRKGKTRRNRGNTSSIRSEWLDEKKLQREEKEIPISIRVFLLASPRSPPLLYGL